MKKILGIVSVYYADTDQLYRNINSYLPFIDHLLIWINTPLAENKQEELRSVFDQEKTEIRTTGRNEGLALPFNAAIAEAKEKEYDYLLTMDQDSYFTEQQFELYKEQFLTFNEKDAGIFSPNINGKLGTEKQYYDLHTAISSGSVFPVSVFDLVGKFDERYFIYMLDIEFCYRIKKKGLAIIGFPQAYMQHEEGYQKNNQLGMKINNYSAQSTYYIIRNTLMTWKLHPEFVTSKEKRYFYQYKIIFRLLKLVFEDEKALKMRAIILGLIHGLTGKSGLYNLKKQIS